LTTQVATAVGFAPGDDGTFFMAFEDWADLFTSVALCSTERAFAKARANDGGGSFSFAASRAGRGKQAGDFGRVKRPHKKDKRLAKRREVVEAATAAAAAERPAEQLVEVEVAAASGTAGTAGAATTEGDAESGGAQVERENARRRRGGDGAQVEPAAAPKKSAACAVL